MSIDNAAERKAQAAQSALGLVANIVGDVNVEAILLIERMLMELYLVFAWLDELGFDRNQFAVLTYAFQQIKYFLTEVGPLATINAVEALHSFWLHNKAFPDGPSHEQYFKTAGLDALAKECFRTMQDAIAMSTIFYPETYQQILGMGLDPVLMSKLQHSHFIKKRYLRDVAEKLLQLCELPANALTKRSSAYAAAGETAAEIKKAAAEAPGHSRRCQSAGSSTDTVPETTASLKSRSMSAGRQSALDWLDDAAAALSRSLEPKP
jgi:hypothetical protein